MPLDLKPKEPVKMDPSTFLIYGSQKSGKSKIVAELTRKFAPEKSLIISTKQEEGRAKLHGGTFRLCPSYNDFKSTINDIKEANKEAKKLVLDFLIIDNCSDLDEWSEHVGTILYQKTTQGASFNIDKKTGKRFKYGDDGYQTVHDIGQGYGYKWSRQMMIEWFDELASLAKHTIFISHTKINKLVTNDNSILLKESEIDLTGKVSAIFAKKADSIAKVILDGEKRYFSFSKKNSDIGTGSAIPFPERVLISENLSDDSENPNIKTYWENIYRNYSK